MNDAPVLLLVSVLLLEEVEGEDTRNHEEECDYCAENAEEALQSRVICVEYNETLIVFKVHLKQLLEANCQQYARNGNGHDVEWCVL